MSVDEIYEMFPNLRERRKSQGSRLSGGEQQMLALARILRTGAPLLLLDEIYRRAGAGDREGARRGRSIGCGSAATPSSWWSRIFALRRRWPIATTWWSTAAWSRRCTRPSSRAHGHAARVPGRLNCEREMGRIENAAGRIELQQKNRGDSRCTSKCSPGMLARHVGAGRAARGRKNKISDDVVRIGVLTDMSGCIRTSAGRARSPPRRWRSTISAARCSARRSSSSSADHQNKADIAAQKAREWYDTGGVDMMTDGTQSGDRARGGQGHRREEDAS